MGIKENVRITTVINILQMLGLHHNMPVNAHRCQGTGSDKIRLFENAVMTSARLIGLLGKGRFLEFVIDILPNHGEYMIADRAILLRVVSVTMVDSL